MDSADMPVERRLSRPGAELAVSELPGRRTPVVFVHGAGMDRSSFTDIAREVNARGHRTVTWDLRGHGESGLADGQRFRAEDALDDLASLRTTLGLEPPVLVGHSLGGNLAQALVLRDPDHARGLVVIGSTSNTGPLTAFERFALRRLSGPLLAMVPARRLPGMLARASATTPSAVSRITEVMARMPRRTFLDVWQATASLVDPDPAYRTPVPLALLRGEHDGTGNIASAMSAWATREGVIEQVIPGAGHVAMWDAPAAIRDAVARAVAEIAG